jgi:uncharacterized Zn-binding protein involved in type VI secretion
MVGLLSGALAGAAMGAAMVAAGAATGGLALVAIVGGCVAGGGLAGGSLARGVMKAMDLPDPMTGAIVGVGSLNVLINRRPAIRAGLDFASCSGLGSHYPLPTALLVEGAQTVIVNGLPMGRVGMKLMCGASIKSGSSDVVVGGPSAVLGAIDDNELRAQFALELLGLSALGAGAIVAALAGGALAVAELAAVAAAMGFGFEKLHEWGESLGPGYGDILAGLAGFGVMAGGTLAARRGAAKSPKTVVEKPPSKAVQELIARRRSQAEVDEWLAAKRADPKLDSLLTDEEYLAIRGYTSGMYRPINASLRAGKPGEFQPLASEASSGLNKMQANGYGREGEVVRLTSLTDEQAAEWFPEGGVHKDRGFFSSSETAQHNFSGNAEIRVNSKNGVEVKSLSEFAHEKEVLFKPDTAFSVDSKTFENGVWHIQLTEL